MSIICCISYDQRVIEQKSVYEKGKNYLFYAKLGDSKILKRLVRKGP